MNFFALFPVIYVCLQFILHLILADAVYSDANKLASSEGPRGTFLVEPRIWWLAVALGGLIATGIYWAIHYSTLRPAKAPHA